MPPEERPWSRSGPDPARDPQRIGALTRSIFRDMGWDEQVARSRVLDDWATLVGAQVADKCAPTSLRDGELRIEAVSTAWATQLRLLSSTLLARIADQVGAGVVRRIDISGPVAPSWKHGRLSVRGRGPRDTYG